MSNRCTKQAEHQILSEDLWRLYHDSQMVNQNNAPRSFFNPHCFIFIRILFPFLCS